MQVAGNAEAQSSPDQDAEDTELMAIYAKQSQAADKVRRRTRGHAKPLGERYGAVKYRTRVWGRTAAPSRVLTLRCGPGNAVCGPLYRADVSVPSVSEQHRVLPVM